MIFSRTSDPVHEGRGSGLPLAVGLAVLAVGLAVTAWSRGRLDYFGDDAYITYRFAKILLESGRFAFNLGDPNTFGATSVLHGMVTALGLSLGADPLVFNRVLQTVMHLAGGGMVAVVAGRIAGDRAIGMAAAGLYLLHPVIAVQSVHGMETGLWLFLHGAALLALALGRPWLLAGALLLLAATRPEGIGFVLAYAVLAVMVDGLQGRRAALFALAGGIVTLTLLWLVFGTVTPASATKFDGLTKLLPRLLSIGSEHNNFLIRHALAGLFVLMLALAAGRPLTLGLFRSSRAARMAAACGLLAVATVAIYYPTNLKMNIFYRLQSPFVLYMLVACAFLYRLSLERQGRSDDQVASIRMAGFLTLLLILAMAAHGWSKAFEVLDRFGAGNNRAHRSVAMLFDRHADILRDKVLYASSAGILNYYFPGRALATYPGAGWTVETMAKYPAPHVIANLTPWRDRDLRIPDGDDRGWLGLYFQARPEDYVLAGSLDFDCGLKTPPASVPGYVWELHGSVLKVFVRRDVAEQLAPLIDDVRAAEPGSHCK